MSGYSSPIVTANPPIERASSMANQQREVLREKHSPTDMIWQFCDVAGIRRYQDGDNLYIFRDCPIGDNVTQCQFGVLDATKNDFSITWHDCGEKSLFSSVEPFSRVGMQYRHDAHVDMISAVRRAAWR
jgi:hypothetical protein